MSDDQPIYERDKDADAIDPDSVALKDRKVVTQNYDLSISSLVGQIEADEIFLRPLSDRPRYQRRYVWNNALASRLIESFLLNVPVPPCYLSQNDDFEMDVIDGQQRIYSIYRFLNNEFALSGLEVLSEFNKKRFHELPPSEQRKLRAHTLRCVVITNESHPDIKFDVFERLNSNTVPLNAQEIRNCVHRGPLNNLLGELSEGADWLDVLGRKGPDRRLRDEELILRFFAFYRQGLVSYRTPLKHWLNDVSKAGKKYTDLDIADCRSAWDRALGNCLIWFRPSNCFRRPNAKALNRALFDLLMSYAVTLTSERAAEVKDDVISVLNSLLDDDDFNDLISRSVDHKSRTDERFRLWSQTLSSFN